MYILHWDNHFLMPIWLQNSGAYFYKSACIAMCIQYRVSQKVMNFLIKCCCSFIFGKKHPWNFHTVTTFEHICWKNAKHVSNLYLMILPGLLPLNFRNNSVFIEFQYIITYCLTFGIFECILFFRIQTKLEQCFRWKTYVPPPVWTDIFLT